MNGTPQPNQKRPLALGIEPGSLDHESQPLTIGPFLTPDSISLMLQCHAFLSFEKGRELVGEMKYTYDTCTTPSGDTWYCKHIS